MGRVLKHAIRSASAWANVWTAVRDAWRTTGSPARYRPEAHYMRGPGPKWRAKHEHICAPNSGRR